MSGRRWRHAFGGRRACGTISCRSRSPLAEEELRNRDQRRALMAVDREMQTFHPYLEMSLDELKARYAKATDAERERLRKLVESGGWVGVQLYERLTSSQRAELLGG